MLKYIFQSGFLIGATFCGTLLESCAHHSATPLNEASELTYFSSDLYPALKDQLSPSPSAGSEVQKRDEEILRHWQKTRSEAECARAESEVHSSFAGLFGPPYGPLTTAEATQMAPFFDKVRNESAYYVQKAKKEFHRPRPSAYLKDLSPCINIEVTGAYPSGHATSAQLSARVLGELFPARAQRFLDRAAQIGQDRVLGGVHHPSDIEAGFKLGDLLYSDLKKSPRFLEDYARLRDSVLVVKP